MTPKQLAKMLSATNKETLEKISSLESENKLNEHVDAIDMSNLIPVDENYEYFPKKGRFKRFLQRIFIVNPFMRYTNKKIFHTKVIGKENIKGIKKAIICSNHVNKLDCMAINYALRPKKVFTSAAPFNSFGGFLGDMMRVGGMIPMSDSFTAMKKFDATVKKLLDGNKFVTFFPERAEWWCYKKPRPLFSGAYKYAVKNDVPVIPVFITYTENAAHAADPTLPPDFVVNIGKPIYPDSSLAPKQRAEDLLSKNASAWQEIYASAYGLTAA